MKETIILTILISQSLIVSCPVVFPQNQSALQTAVARDDARRIWRAARYRGLTMGKSKLSDMLRIFGAPQRSEVFGQGKSRSEVWYHYEGVWEFSGTLTFTVAKPTNTILSVEMRPKVLRKEDAIKYFGADYIITTYDFDLCLGDEESAPLFESPAGSVIYVEYRQRGIAIAVNYLGNVDEINYVSKPLGTRKSRCKHPTKQKHRRNKQAMDS